ncbi:MAG: hypothetical protein RR966_15180, partial [Acinetobacter sp.]
MNAMQHARISAKRWGGEPEDYYEIHRFIDSTKSLCSDARHRILHTLWGVNSVVVPVFGHSLQNSAGKSIDIKDLCERDHLLVDYQQRFIPTLNDFVNAIDATQLPKNFEQQLEQLHQYYLQDKTLSQLMLSPLALTGKLHSLLLTHNSWFIYDILPRIGQLPKLENILYSPADFFNAMRFEL